MPQKKKVRIIETPSDSLSMVGMMKGKIAMEDAMGNPSAHRMVQNYPHTYTFTGQENIPAWVQNRPPAGAQGTHYMSSQDNYAVPYIQQRGKGLQYIDNASGRDKEAMKFKSPQDAEYFGNHYKEVAPMMRNWEMKVGGYIPEADRQWNWASGANIPGYQDYGSMYSIPGKQGLLQKMPSDIGWEGFGNSANLITNQPVEQRVSAPLRQPVRGVARQNPDNYYDGEGDISDYSIDRVREQNMKMGGTMKKKVTIVEVPQMRNGGWASQVHGGLYLPYPLSYDAKPYQETDPEYRMKKTLSPVPREDSDIEAEKGEHIVGDFDGDGAPESMGVGGKRHSEGGTPLSVPDGSFVYSDTKKLKIKDPDILSMFDATKPATPGKLAKKYPLNDWKSQMENPDTDPLQRKTAEMMYENNIRKLGQLKQVQELQKQSMGISNNPQRMDTGGYTAPDILVSTRGLYASKIPLGPKSLTGNNNWIGSIPYDQQNPSAATPANIQQNVQDDNLGTAPLAKYKVPYPGPENETELPTDPYTEQVPYAGNRYTPAKVTAPTTTPEGKKRKVRIEGLSADAMEDIALGMKALNTKKYSPWEPAVQVVKPQLLLESDQPIRNVLAENTNVLANALYSGDTKAGRAAVSNAQGELLRRSVQAAGEVGNRSQVTGNRYSELIANLDNQRLQAERERGTRLYDKSVIADQQYRNSLNALGQQYADTGRQREERESFRQWQNKTSPYFMTDKRGRPEFKSNDARDKFLLEQDRISRGETATGTGKEKTYEDWYNYYTTTMGVKDPEVAADMANDQIRAATKLPSTSRSNSRKTPTGTERTTVKSKYGGLLASRRC